MRFHNLNRQIYFVILGMIACLIAGGMNTNSAVAKSAGTITLTNPADSGTEVGETSEYRSLLWKDPWDMNNIGDVVQLDSPCIQANQFSSSTFSNGIWTGTPNPVYGEDHWAFLLSPGYRGALSSGMDGRLKPIDPKIYTQLTIKMYVSSVDPVSDPGARLIWTRKDVKAIGNPQESSDWGESNYFRTYSGWHIYSIDLTQIGLLSFSPSKLKWTDADKITGLRIDPDQKSGGKTIQIDWVRLSPKSNYPVAWNAAGVTGSTQVSFGVNSNDGQGVIPIHFYAGNVQYNVAQEERILANANSFSFPASLPPGNQQLHATVDGNTSTGTWNVNGDPILTFTNPSMTSGEEYARSALNDPWDFNSMNDLASTQNVTSSSIENGAFKGTHAATGGACSEQWSDSGVFMRMGAPIDSSKYRYLSFKTRLDGTPDISFGWMSRIIWYDGTGFPNVGTSEDVINREGWNTHVIDLWRSDLQDDEDPGMRGWKQGAVHQLRIDVDEVPAAQTFYLDDVELFAEPVSTGLFTATWSLSGASRSANGPDAATITLGYDTDAQGFNGTVIATGISGNQYVWDTSGVASGTYYLYAIVNDGINETRFYSDVPLRVVSQASNLALTEPNGSGDTVPLADEFSRDVLQNAWDMSSAADIDQTDSGRYGNLTPPTFTSGILNATSTTNDPYFWLSWDINKSIQANQYNKLSFYMHSASAGSGQIWWIRNDDPNNLKAGPKFAVYPGWRIYTFDLSQHAEWSNTVRVIRIDPIETANVALKLDWAKLTKKEQFTFNVAWTGQNLNESLISLYYSPTADGNEKFLFAEAIPASNRSYAWDTSPLAQGQYYVFANVTTGFGGGIWFGSTYPVTVGIDPATLTNKSYIPLIQR